VLEAYEGYCRKRPHVKRLIFKAVPDDSTRLAMLKRGEADITYSIRGALAEELRRTPGLTLKPTAPTFTEWLVFAEQWDPKSPWADRRVRLAANLATDRKTINEAEYLGFGSISASIIPRDFEFYWPAPPYPYDPARARQLLAEAGYPKGFDAGPVATDMVYAPTAEALVNYLQAVGIRAQVRAMERAAFYKADQEKKLRPLVRVGSAAFGNAATRIEAFVLSSGIRAYGGYPDIDGLYQEQASELDTKKREASLHRIQRLMHERAMFAPIVEPAFLCGYGPGVVRPQIAIGKAWGALGMGVGTRALARRVAEQPQLQPFFASLSALSEGRIVPVPGGVLIRDAGRAILGAVGISGDTSDKDEACALAGIEAAKLVGDGG